MGKNVYVLITAARDEANFLEKTIKAVISQTVLPKKWVIVSDGSTDRTDEIAGRYAAEYEFLEFIRVKANDTRNFASKVNAIRAGYEQLEGIEYEFVGNLDADVSFEPNYYERVLEKFQQGRKLGIAGGIILEKDSEQFVRRFGESDVCVAGAIQLFRRECYEEIGGYIPLKYGGVDAVAKEMANMHGWEVRSFPEIAVLHYRQSGTGGANMYLARFIDGKEDYSLGYQPLFFFTKCMYRVLERPYVVGSLLRLSGYCWSACRREKREVSADFVKYIRQGQLHRLVSTDSYKQLFNKLLLLSGLRAS